MKICTGCLIEKELSSFRTKRDKHASRCKECDKEYDKNRRAKIKSDNENRILDSNLNLKCYDCKETKHCSNFHKDLYTKTGYKGNCISCSSLRFSKWSDQLRQRSTKEIIFPEFYKCSSCSELLPINSFWKDITSKLGFDSRCIKCNSQRKLIYRSSERGKETSRQQDNRRRSRKEKILDLMPDGWWNILLSVSEFKCCISDCTKEITDKNPLTHDHIIPVSWENSVNSLSNSQVMCFSHNASKSNKESVDYRTESQILQLKIIEESHLASVT